MCTQQHVFSDWVQAMSYINAYINAQSVDPVQTPHSAASDLGLHCLPMSSLMGR